MITINGTPTKAHHLAFDGCHKIYLCECPADIREAEHAGYTVRPIEDLLDTYDAACPLKFISNWQLTVSYVEQGARAFIRINKLCPSCEDAACEAKPGECGQ